MLTEWLLSFGSYPEISLKGARALRDEARRGSTQANIAMDEFDYRRRTGKGMVNWYRAPFEQLPLQFKVVNAIADLPVEEIVEAELVSFSGPASPSPPIPCARSNRPDDDAVGQAEWRVMGERQDGAVCPASRPRQRPRS